MEKTLIQSLEEEIKAKKLLLKAIKAEEKEKNKVLFTETKFGKACLKSLATVTSPFRKLNETATAHLESPVMAHYSGLESEATELVKKATAVNPGDKNAIRMANECARLCIELDMFLEKHEIPEGCEGDRLLNALKDQLQRLRPPADPDRFAVLNTQLEATVPQA